MAQPLPGEQRHLCIEHLGELAKPDDGGQELVVRAHFTISIRMDRVAAMLHRFEPGIPCALFGKPNVSIEELPKLFEAEFISSARPRRWTGLPFA